MLRSLTTRGPLDGEAYLRYPGRNWTRAHRRWVAELRWDYATERHVVEDYLLAIEQVEHRLSELDARLVELAATAPYRDPVAWLRCFRGIDTLSAILIMTELHDFRRFPTATALMAYLGLVPREAQVASTIGAGVSPKLATRWSAAY